MSTLIEIQKKNVDPGYFVVNWMLHDKCTYDCSYCPPSNKAGDDKWLELDFSKKFLDDLEIWLQSQHPNKPVLFLLTGGEPTVWPGFVQLIEHIKSKKDWYISMSTNGSRSLRWWEENHNKIDSLSISFHSEFADPDEFIEKITFLNQQRVNKNFKVNLMMNPRRWSVCLDIVERLQSCNPPVLVDLQLLQKNFGLQDLDIDDYTDEQKKLISELDLKCKKIYKAATINKDRGQIPVTGSWAIYEDKKEHLEPHHLLMNGKVNFYGWHCNIGLEQIFINSLGKVYGGTCLQGPLLGQINKGTVSWAKTPTVCQSKWCGCHTDIFVSKWKSL